ncbi:TRNA/rRNA cytosine-C5-methylase [Spironucleus salmonicida]|uniref:tRNA/rRNA cytosine-C5-methylase n=1 Tax=Spironucleus salmonicida TaxID=348837 RepID=V6LUJ7_9EUKA|nr:TRNA/rRNA cytosine-C5-methylase [Spironucleus salmonicida]|eukprot:EST44484.1 tRNA/rRNA cytosine-C5-methylase [Spironucleus salmonicida]
MQDIYQQAGQCLIDFYNQKSGLKTLCLAQKTSPGKTYLLALKVGYNYKIFQQALKFTVPTQDLFTQASIIVQSLEAKILPNKRLRLSKQTRDSLKQVRPLWPELQNTILLHSPPQKHHWIRSITQPESSTPSQFIPNFYLLNEAPKCENMIQGELQTLASGLPAEALYQYFKSEASQLTVLDACAAPGSKSLQLATHFKHVTANERDQKRSKILQKRAQNVKNLTVRTSDAFQAFQDPYDLILLDPTCSGSGTLNLDFQIAQQMGAERDRADTSQLHKFQVKILTAALESNAYGVVYSTCSVNKEENEDVVQEVLAENRKWKLVDALPQWPLRSKSITECAICNEEMQSEGFFVALFVRK